MTGQVPLSPGQRRRRALLLACGTFDDPAFPALHSPTHDARALTDTLGRPDIAGYDVVSRVDCSTAEARVAIQEFFRQARPGDISLVYVSSHGVQDARGDLHFVFRDTQKTVLDATAVSADWCKRQIYGSRSGSTIVLLDCCFSGAFIRGMQPRGVDTNVAQLVQGLPEGSGVAVLTASGETEYSLEASEDRAAAAERPSYFTEALLAGIDTGAADANRDGRITVDELYTFIVRRLRLGPSPQRPQRMGHGEGELVIARAPQHAPEPPLPPTPPPRPAPRIDSPVLLSPVSAAPSSALPMVAVPRRTQGRPSAVYGRARPPAPSTALPPVDRPRRRRATGLIITLLVLLLGCAGATYGAWQLLTDRGMSNGGTGSAVERMAKTKGGKSGDLTVTVSSVRVSSSRTYVDVTAKNSGSANLSLPVWGNCSVIEPDGAAHEGSTRSEFPKDIPRQQTVRGTMVFDGAIARTTGSVDLACSTIFGRGGGDGVQVNDIALKPAP